MYMYTYIYIYIYTYVCVCINIYIYIYVYTDRSKEKGGENRGGAAILRGGGLHETLRRLDRKFRKPPSGNGGFQIGTEGDLLAVCPSKDNCIHFGSNF